MEDNSHNTSSNSIEIVLLQKTDNGISSPLEQPQKNSDLGDDHENKSIEDGSTSSDSETATTTTADMFPVLSDPITRNHPAGFGDLCYDDEDYDDDLEEQTMRVMEITADNEPAKLHILLVVTLTAVGAIDEVAMYPALITGNVFTVAELTLATVLGAFLTMVVFRLFFTPCRPFIAFLERIPLYAVVAFYATMLSVEVVYETLG
jgi:hypothetical protein